MSESIRRLKMGTAEGAAPQVTQPGAVRVRRALLTVSDKRGLVDLARGVAEL
jgi:phosphoribosylaminoimidazolecarboxamide formyltransferase / IMP cyclohydrolase